MKNLIRFILVMVLSSSLTIIIAQPSGDYERETIYFKGTSYVKNNQSYPIGFMYGKMKKDMRVSPEGFALFQKSQKQKRWAFALSTAAMAAAIVAFSDLNNRNVDEGLRYGLLGGSMALSFTSLPFSTASSRNLHKAVWIRNGDVLE